MEEGVITISVGEESHHESERRPPNPKRLGRKILEIRDIISLSISYLKRET